jgi:O-antigen/teichoic acid export membrane protein
LSTAPCAQFVLSHRVGPTFAKALLHVPAHSFFSSLNWDVRGYCEQHAACGCLVVTQIQRNLLANLFSSVWVPLLWFVTVPQYIKALGAESFGLVGLFTTIQAIVAMLDLGLSMTLNREFARLNSDPAQRPRMRNLLRTMEALYWAVALAIALMVLLGADVVATHWLRSDALAVDEVRRTVRVMALTLAFQWPLTLYSGGLMGLQRQTTLATINVLLYSFRYAGVIPILWFVDASAYTFFVFQAVVSLIHTVFAAICLWRNVPEPEHRPMLRWSLLQSQLHFAIGLFLVAFLDMLLNQTDKVVLSKLLPLETFGYYSIASLGAVALYRLYGAVVSTMYPPLTQLAENRREREMAALYHSGCQVMAVLNYSVGVVIVFFPREVLFVWLGDYRVADSIGTVLSLLVIGTSMRGLMYLPNALQFAHGWTRLTLASNLCGLLILVPCTVALSSFYGATGAAVAWIVLNLVYLLVTPRLLHQRVLRGHATAWYWRDLSLPLIGPVALIAFARFTLPDALSRTEWAGVLVLLFVLAAAAAAAGAPLARAAAADAFGRLLDAAYRKRRRA